VALTAHHIRLTSAEISQLWSGYMGDSMARQVLRYFWHKAEDAEVKAVLEYALHLTERHLQTLTELFVSESFPVPHGFTDDDANVDAKRLYSDIFFLHYLYNTAKQGLPLYGFALSASARSDVREYFSECIASTTELYNRVVETMLSKGVYIRAPYIPLPESVEYVHKESFLNGLFGDRRPLTSAEITHLHLNIQTNALGKSLISGFAQTARLDEVKAYFLRGKEIAHKQLEVFSSYLRDEELPAPTSWDADVTDSTDAPFSDKLMLFHISGLTAAGFFNYGAAVSTSMRRDLSAAYARLSAEIAAYAEDGVEMIIRHGWLEKIPGNIDRRVLADSSK